MDKRQARRHERFTVSLWAIERTGSWVYYHLVTNLSLGGAFLHKHDPIPVGTKLNLELELPGKRWIRAAARVVREHREKNVKGSGVELKGLLPDDVLQLRQFLGAAPTT